MVVLNESLRPERTELRPDGEWLRVDDVPLFDEHTGDDGVVYDKRLLTQIAENNNTRIRDSGDYCPIVILHTDDPAVDEDPPVIGMAGPFRLGLFGKENPRYCIMGTFWVDPKEEELFRKYPRRSVELWGEEKPEDRFFDPISLLGAETPKRDLGILYAKRSGNSKPIKYEMEGGGPVNVGSIPTGTNSFIPGTGKQKKKRHPDTYEREPMALSPEELDQIKQAIMPMVEAMIDEQNAAAPNDEEMVGEEGLPVEEEGMPMEGEEGGIPMEAPLGGPEGMPPEGMPGGMPPEDEARPFEKYMKENSEAMAKTHYQNLTRYCKADDREGYDEYVENMDDGDRKKVDDYMAGMGDSMDSGAGMEGEPQMNAETGLGGLGQAGGAALGRSAGAALGSAVGPVGTAVGGALGGAAGSALGGSLGDKASNWWGESNKNRYRKGDDMSSESSQEGTPARYRKSERYRSVERRNRQLVQQNQKLMKSNQDLHDEKIRLRAEVKRYRRKTDLQQMEMQGVVITDPDELVEDTLGMSEDQWSKQLYRMEAENARVPLDTGNLTDGVSEVHDRTRSKEDDVVQSQAKKAAEILLRYRRKGKKNLDYPAVLHHLKENNGEFNLEKFESAV
jgi:hypothetical protein